MHLGQRTFWTRFWCWIFFDCFFFLSFKKQSRPLKTAWRQMRPPRLCSTWSHQTTYWTRSACVRRLTLCWCWRRGGRGYCGHGGILLPSYASSMFSACSFKFRLRWGLKSEAGNGEVSSRRFYLNILGTSVIQVIVVVKAQMRASSISRHVLCIQSKASFSTDTGISLSFFPDHLQHSHFPKNCFSISVQESLW